MKHLGLIRKQEFKAELLKEYLWKAGHGTEVEHHGDCLKYCLLRCAHIVVLVHVEMMAFCLVRWKFGKYLSESNSSKTGTTLKLKIDTLRFKDLYKICDCDILRGVNGRCQSFNLW